MLHSTPAPARRLVILLHGIGGTGATLLPLARSWMGATGDVRVIAPDAPFPHESGFGRQWFSLDGLEYTPGRIRSVRQSFDEHMQRLVEEEGFADRHGDIAFLGFSQGAILALDAVATGRWQVGAVAAFAGLLPTPPVRGLEKPAPVLLVHGADDRTIPAVASVAAARDLKAAGFPATLHLLPGIGHTVTAEGADLAHRFLHTSLGI